MDLDLLGELLDRDFLLDLALDLVLDLRTLGLDLDVVRDRDVRLFGASLSLYSFSFRLSLSLYFALFSLCSFSFAASGAFFAFFASSAFLSAAFFLAATSFFVTPSSFFFLLPLRQLSPIHRHHQRDPQ